MTYTAEFVVTKGTDDVPDMHDDNVPAAIEQVRQYNANATDAAGEQLAAVRKAVAELVAAVGPDDGQVLVHVIGHANPDHAVTAGWANESLTITLNHVS